MDRRALAAVLVMACAPPVVHAQTWPVAFKGAAGWDVEATRTLQAVYIAGTTMD